ncbi:aldo/keto reductase [Epibacterium sp. SM1979]|uniref:Aldo/keto reductase n=1 Tax=Tritonibacter litoralis TaxID=2662264 RepID=A0A843YGR8_9RHOB|nr:aldo/keto reductase [Tritonibacter litoralis]MQQ08855.1 aldo/keto reductase [Tritonibacter litoralis]
MKQNRLGRTDIMVSEYCLGTMTFGTQTDEADAHGQLDMALDAGINFLDTAEMYPVNPIRAETIGDSEAIIGRWIEKSGRRGDYVLATKHSGEGLKAVRDGAPISKDSIAATVEGSLKRLKTDYIDLYQFHWPNRGSFMFRKNWSFAPWNSGHTLDDIRADMESCLEALQEQVDKGNIRAFGLSNEGAWGTAQWLQLSEAGKGPRVSTMQNEYSMLCRLYDTDLAEMSIYEEVGLIAYSPLATGLLTGKYQGGEIPEGSRMSINDNLGGRVSPRVFAAVEAYLEIARKHDLDPTQMALAWCKTRPFMASVIFGATSQTQLAHIIAGKDLELSADVVAEIDAAHKAHPMPY